jgi:ferritin-like metal-binding protein YciE
MSLDSVHDLLLHQLRDLHCAERQVLRVWPELILHAHSRNLALVLEEHRTETVRQIARLHECAEILGASPHGVRCRGMESLMVECLASLAGHRDPAVRDAGIIADCQRITGYQLAVYGNARIFAEALELDHVVRLLDRTIAEEEVTDARLTAIAEHEVNPRAIASAIRNANDDDDKAIPITRARRWRTLQA